MCSAKQQHCNRRIGAATPAMQAVHPLANSRSLYCTTHTPIRKSPRSQAPVHFAPQAIDLMLNASHKPPQH